MKKTIAKILIFVVMFSVFTGQNLFATEIAKDKTTLKGVAYRVTCSYKKELTRDLTVTPANDGRTVRLQLYSNKTQRYRTIKVYKTEKGNTATVKITFPKEYRRRRTGTWRIVVDGDKNATTAVKNVTVTTTNIVTKKLNSGSACIWCIEDEQLIYGKFSRKRRKQASTTKIMTATLLLESGEYGGTTKVSRNAAWTEYGYLNMTPGDVYTYKSLMYALMLPSSNDAATAIAEGIGGSVSGFAKKMNAKAKELGLKDTHYVTPHGLDAKNHYSSAYDVSLTMGYIYSTSMEFRTVIATRKYSFKTKRDKERKTVYTTDMLKDYSPNHKGGKTGYTSHAGSCFSGVYEYNGKTYVVTVLGAKSANLRWDDMKKLYQYIDKYADTKY